MLIYTNDVCSESAEAETEGKITHFSADISRFEQKLHNCNEKMLKTSLLSLLIRNFAIG